MFSNAKKFYEQLRANFILISDILFAVATVICIVIVIRYEAPEPKRIEPEPEQISTEVTGFDEQIFELIRDSKFEFVRKSKLGDIITYEVYVKQPISGTDDIKSFNSELLNLWAQHKQNAHVRVAVLNYGDMELVDFLTEDGAIIYKRR